MPRSARAAPRNMLPPPTTAATCPPSFTAAMISAARWATTSGEMPRGSVPANSPPDSFSTTRRQLGWSTPAGPDSGIRPFLVVCLVLAWPCSGLADLEPGEAGDGDAVLRQDLLDRGVLVLHERLLGEHDVLEVGVQPAVHDLADGLLRLALVTGDLLGDAALLLHHVGRDLVPRGVERTHRGHLLGQVLGHLGVVLVELDEHAQGRRQGRVAAVQVARHVAALEPGEPAELQLLLQARAGLVDQLLDGGARAGLGGQQGQPVGDLGEDRGLRDLRGCLMEQVGLRDEVRLAVQLDQHAGLGAVKVGHDQAVGRGAGGALVHVLGALEPKQLDRRLDVPVGFIECVLAVHHAGAGLLTEPLYVSGGKIRHVLVSRYVLNLASWFAGYSAAVSPVASAVSAVSAVGSAASTVSAVGSAASTVSAVGSAASTVSAMSSRSSASSAAAASSVVIADSALISGVASATAAATVGVSGRGGSSAVSAGAAAGAAAEAEPWSSSRSHSAKGSSVPSRSPEGFSSPEAAPARAIRPSATASATTLVRSATLRIASSLPGIG